MTKPLACRSLFAAALALLLVVPANAGSLWDAISDFQKPNMKVGQLELHPYYSLGETYDSNIFLQPRSGVKGNNANNNTDGPVLGSWITSNNFGLKTKLPISEMHTFAANYDFVWKDYSKDPHTNNTVNQAVNGSYQYKGPEGVSAKLSDDYLNTVDPATNELVARERRWQNTGAGSVEYAPEGGNLFAAADGWDTTHKYVANDPVIRAALDRVELGGGLKAGWRLQPKTRVFAAYHRQEIHYTVHQNSPNNNRSHLVDLGIEGDIAPKLTGRIQGGFEYRKYDNAPTPNSSKIARNFSIATLVNYKPIERTSIDLSLSRSLQAAVFANNQFFTATAGGLTVTHKLPYKLTAGVNGGMEVDSFPQAATVGGVTANRRDDNYTTGATLGYDIQEWLKVGTAYTYRARFTRNYSEQFNYRDHLTSVNLSVLF